jgi:glucokinase
LRLFGVDVGGSAIKLGAVAPDGSAREERALAPSPDAALVLDALASALRELGHRPPAPVGVGLPGLFDRRAGRVLASPNLPWLEGLAIGDELSGRLALEPASVRLENDANAAALGELWLGAGRDARDFLLVTLGTGVGGGLVLGGELVLGAGLAGEIGHVVVDPEGPPCGCGGRGCVEALASASAARRRALAAGLPAERPGDLELLAERARAGPGPERELARAIGADLGRGLAAAVALLDLRRFLFGGGFSAALDTLEAGIRQGIAERAYGDRGSSIRLERALLGASAGWIGAAAIGLPTRT